MRAPTMQSSTPTRGRRRMPRLAGRLCAARLAGCASLSDQMDRLNQSLLSYEKAIRWGEFDSAYAMHKEPPPVPAALKNVRVTRYEVKERNYDQTTQTARQTVMIQYYSLDTSREVTVEDRQEWEYLKEAQRWRRTDEPPRFE